MLIRIWNSDPVVLIRRLSIVYGVLMICRIVFYLYNQALIGPTGISELGQLARGALMFDSISVVYANGLFILLSLLPFRVREKEAYRKMLFWCFIVVNSTVVALNLFDIVYFHYTRSRIAIHDFMLAANDNALRLVFKFIFENWFFVPLCGALILLMVWLYRRTGKPVTAIANRTVYYVLNFAILCIFALVSVAAVRGGGLKRTIRPVAMGDAARFAESPAKAGMILSNPFCIIRTLGNARINYTEYFDGKELDGIFSPSHYPAAGSRTAVILGKRNIVIFLLESFSAEHSALLNPSLYPDGGGYTPFLDSLMLRGYYMTRAYANGRKSIEALPAILASMPSFKTPFALMPQGLGDGMQLPKILAAEGYETMFFCGSPDGSMGFDAYTKLSGVEKSYSKNDYDRRYPGNNAFDGYWGIWDEEFMDFMGEVLNDCRQPFFSVMFTLSSHHPYIVPERYADSLPQGITKIHKPVAYTDMSVRRFFEKYGGEEWFENSLFVFVADHVSPEKFSDESNTAMGSHRIVSFLYAPDSPLSGRCDDVFQQVDIMPTVLGLVGYDKPYFAFGRDIFGEPEREPVAFNYFGGFNIADDSIVLSFDEKNSTSVFALGDTLEKNNIMADDDPRQKNLSDMIKAVIQQYYLHIGKRSYVVEQE